ncbi:MAG TPA: glycerophosphodiester phosphodiesterase [Casimicrobiaceae bacterium]|nr:glycerophosphodiester phosphodiesterase [Casimicrobiaceae bacterium]
MASLPCPWLARLALAGAFAAALPAAAFDLQGHRGARGLAPENTLAAFRKALSVGVTTLETDVGITRDGIAVIAHDRHLNPAIARGADGKWIPDPGPVLRTLDFAQLREFDVGRLDPASSYAKQFPQQEPADGERIPALDDVLALARAHPRPVRLNLETKLSPLAPGDTVDPATFVRTVVGAVKRAGLLDRTTLQSFDWRTLLEAKALEPRMGTVCLTLEGGANDNVKPDASGRSPWLAGIGPDSVPRMAKQARCDVWSPFWRNVTRERIAEAKGLGLAVIPWTVNEPADMQAMIDLGVDGLITDYPDRARAVLAGRGLPLP